MNHKKKQEIPLGAFDSELMHQEINIPDGFEATIDGNKIILKKEESEDEKIRKFLIKWIQDNYYHGTTEIPTKTLIAWLEKQGKSDKIVEKAKIEKQRVLVTESDGSANIDWDTCSLEDARKLLECGLQYINTELEKQGEQKPADKVEPKFKVKYAGSEYNVLETKNIVGVTFYGIEDEPNHIDYVKADNCEIISGYGIKESGLSFPTKPAIFSEQKPAWSQEDEKIILAISQLLKDCESENGWNCVYSHDREVFFADIENYLQSLKNRVIPQSKQEWTEKDERIIKEIDEIIYECPYCESKEEIANWLKCLKDKFQPQWKPSDEQMNALDSVIDEFDGYPEYDSLVSLKTDLRKL